MQILLNELSLIGQFEDQAAFIHQGMLPLLGILKEMKGFTTLLLKKSDLWESRVTPDRSLHDFLTDPSLRRFDEFRRFKSAIASLTSEPFWDNDSRQHPDTRYMLADSDIRGSSPAEACERDRTVVSFTGSPSSADSLDILRDEISVSIRNLTRPGGLTEYLWQQDVISFETYVKARFSVGKLDFTTVDASMGFEVVEPVQHTLFIDSFRKFEELAWEQIYEDPGFQYKEYHGAVAERYRGQRTHKFRVSQKFRCHGFRAGNSFFVLGFEMDHKLSDRG